MRREPPSRMLDAFFIKLGHQAYEERPLRSRPTWDWSEY